jgi:hypothetical protein
LENIVRIIKKKCVDSVRPIKLVMKSAEVVTKALVGAKRLRRTLERDLNFYFGPSESKKVRMDELNVDNLLRRK